MPILLDKVLTELVLPPGLMLAGLALAGVLGMFRFRRSAVTLAVLSAVSLWMAATPLVSGRLAASLEAQYPPLPVEALPSADVVIVLGGAISPPEGGNPYPDLHDAADRLFHALRIYKAGKAQMILLSGGQVFDPDSPVNEASAMADMLVSFGVPREALMIEGRSRNTYENARNSADIWRDRQFKSGLLVTSGSHMPRALATFRRAGLAVEPASTDAAETADLAPFPLPLLPDAGALDVTAHMLKEWIGVIMYRWRGWA